MNTRIIRIDRDNIDDGLLSEAATILREGGLVAFPTETVYGLGADALDETAAKKIYEAKGRPSDNPLIAHIADEGGLKRLVSAIPDTAIKLMKACWPGPLTLIFPKKDDVPLTTTGGLMTVAIRMPSDEIARHLIKLTGVPVAAPSANISGRPSPTRADHVIKDLDGKIDMIIDGGEVGIGVESTIVDVTEDIPVLLRPGAVTLEMLEEIVGEVKIDPAVSGPVDKDMKPRAPGMKYRHYAPRAELTIVKSRDGLDCSTDDTDEDVIRTIQKLTKEKIDKGSKVGIICTEETKERYTDGIVRSLGFRDDEDMIARSLFAVLREFDDLGADYIFSESFSDDNLGRAIMNRLNKAAGYHIIEADEG